MEFSDIFKEYYSMFRGQATSIPTYGDREFTLATHYGNNAIRKWARVDGTLWRELYARATDQNTTVWPGAARTIASGTVSYNAPSNMRKPPRKVFFYTGSEYDEVAVIDPEKLAGLSELSSAVSFLGSANTGYTMHITAALADQMDGKGIDYLYFREPTTLSTSNDPSSTVVDMSDPNYMVQEMLTLRYTNERNGFGVQVARAEAKAALINMKIENSSGVPGKSDNLGLNFGEWGQNQPVKDIDLS